MLNYLYNHIPAFRTWANKKAFDNQSKPNGFEGAEVVFTDSNGKRYYKYKDDFDLPVARFGKLQDAITELERRLTRNEVELFLNAMEQSIMTGIRSNSQEGMVKEFAKLTVLVDEMEFREEVVLHPEIFFDIAAIAYIREDENPAVFDLDIQLQKIAQFKLDSTGGLRDFFYESSLKAYLPFFDLSNSDLGQLFQLMEQTIQSKLASISRLS